MEGEWLTPKYNPSVIVLSFGIAFLGSYLSITLCYLLSLLESGSFKLKVFGRKGVLLAMACALGGIGVWSMHFVGMFSLRLYRPDGTCVPVSFHLFPTLLSLVFVALFAGGGIYIASHDVMFGKSKSQIVEIYMKEACKMSIKEIKHTSTARMIRIISTQSLLHLICGGVLAGAGVSVMHYLGMWGMMFTDGRIVWDVGIVVASVLIAIIASTAAFWILFRFLSLYPHLEVLRIASSLIMAIAVCGMHYTGMMAAKFRYEPGAESITLSKSLQSHITGDEAYYGVLLADLLLGVMLVMASLMELRFWIYNVTSDIKRHAALVEQLCRENCPSRALDNFLNRPQKILSSANSVSVSKYTAQARVHPSAAHHRPNNTDEVTPFNTTSKNSNNKSAKTDSLTTSGLDDVALFRISEKINPSELSCTMLDV